MDAIDLANKTAIDYPGLLGGVPGLDWHRAARDLLGGDLESYSSFVLLFESTHAQDADGVMDALAQGDVATATQLCHTLKGAAGTLGFFEVFSLAKSLEQDLKAGLGLEPLRQRLETLCGLLRDICLAVSHLRQAL